MTIQTKNTSKQSKVDLQDVTNYIKENPNFLNENSHLIDLIYPPSKEQDSILDLQEHMIRKLQKSTKNLKKINNQLMSLAKVNFESTQQIHDLLLNIYKSKNIEDFILAITEEIPNLSKIDKVSLFFENTKFFDKSPLKSKLRFSSSEKILKNFNYAENVCISDNIEKEFLFDPAYKITSYAMIKLSLENSKSVALIILGSKDNSYFNDSQETNLLSFLGSSISHHLNLWLNK